MTEVVVIREPVTVMQVEARPVVVQAAQPGLPGPPGPPGPPGANGIGAISSDGGNAIRTGTDGGLYCPAVVVNTLHW